MTNIEQNFFSEKDFDKLFQDQVNDKETKEKERLVLNEFCKDGSIPSDVKAEAIIDFAKKWEGK